MARVARLQSLLPRAPRLARDEEGASILSFQPSGPRGKPNSEAPWGHHVRVNSSRLVLTLDMSNEATEFRNQLKEKYFHSWGGFPDTRFELLDPLPDRQFYIDMYKTTINELCATGPPELPMGPTMDFFASEGKTPSGLVKHIYQKEYVQGEHVKQPKEPSKGHFLILASFSKGSPAHLLRDYFIKKLSKFQNIEVQRAMGNLGKERYKAHLPLGFCRDMGMVHAISLRDRVAHQFKGTEGLHLGTAVSLSLWRKHYDLNPDKRWNEMVLVKQECIYSRALEGTSKQRSSSFVSIAPEKQSLKETSETGDEKAYSLRLSSDITN